MTPDPNSLRRCEPVVAVIDLLEDLEHDLGKYIRLPLAMLPRDASNADIRVAVERALLQTRRTHTSTQSASEIWSKFQRAAGPQLRDRPGYRVLIEAIERALAWAVELDREPSAPIDRPRLERDLGAVGQAIRAAIREVAV